MILKTVFSDSIGMVGITFGSWELFHSGHVAFLAECRRQCDHLIVGLHRDPSVERSFKNAPVQSVMERTLQLGGCAFVDNIVVYETEQDIIDLLTLLPVGCRFLGSDYENKDFTGKELCDKKQIKIVYIPRLDHVSSSGLRARIASAENK